MRRRTFIGGAATGLVTSIARAGQRKKPLIGFLGLTSAESFAAPLAAFRAGLGSQGFVEGKNVAVVYRWAGGDGAKLPALATELVRLKPEVIATSGGPLPARAAEAATRTIPIVASSALGSVANFARPGGNLTGAATQTIQLLPKRLQLLHEAVPRARLVAYLANPSSANAADAAKLVAAAAAALGIRILTAETHSAAEFEVAFATFAKAGAGALLVMPDPYFFAQHRAIVALALQDKLPAIYEWAEIAEHGGLMAYGDSLKALYQRVGDYAGRILKGATPAQLPLDEPAAIRLVINQNTAKQMGFAFPPEILVRADEVIQ